MLYRITLTLARCSAFPEGSDRHGYELVAPLDAEYRLDREAWLALRHHCNVRRFSAGEPDRHGLLLHRPGGFRGATWLIDYDADRSDDDETGVRLDAKSFRAGEYVTIGDRHGRQTFAVALVEALPASPRRAAAAW